MVDVVFEHPDGREQRIRKVSPVQTRRGAEQYERELRQALLEGSYGRKEELIEVPRFDAFADTFLTTYARANNKPSEVDTKKTILDNHLKPAFGKLHLDGIGAQQIETYKAIKLEEGLSPKYVNNHLTVLRKLLDVAREWGKLATLPNVLWLPVPEAAFRFLDFDEAERLVTAAQEPWRTMIVVALRTGLRQGELLALSWQDVDLVAGRLRVVRSRYKDTIGTPKSKRSREVPLSAGAVRALKSHRHLRGELVFCGESGRHLTKGECKWPLWTTCKRAGLPRIGWHVLRHTFASHLVMRGVPLKAVQELMGHATIEMTMRYAHLSPDVGRGAVDRLDEPRPHYGTRAAHEAANEKNMAKTSAN
jgi:integrase